MNKMFLKKTAAVLEVAEETSSGKVKGIAYSGEVIKSHGPFQSLVIDLATTTVAKSKTPILRDHDMSAIAGHGTLTIADNKITLDGTLSSKTPWGIEVKELAQEGFDWEMSIGLFDFDIQEVTNEKVNGNMLEKGIVFRNGVLREVSLLSLGADMGTSVEVFNFKEGDTMSTLTKEQWAKFACGCGGTEKSSTEDLKANFDAKDEKIDELTKEIEALKKVLADKEAEEEKIKVEEDQKLRADQISAALSKKSVKFSDEQIKKASLTQESTALLLSYVEGITIEAPEKKKEISEKFSKKVEVGNDVKTSGDKVKDLSLAAELLVTEGKAKDLMQAFDMLEEK